MTYAFEVEINWEKDCKLKNWQCDKCEKHAVIECELNIYKRGDLSKSYGVYCKDHFDSLMDETSEELQNPSEPDFDDIGD